MFVDAKSIEYNKEERAKVFALRLAHHLGIYENVDVFEKLPARVQVHFSRMTYGDLIHQLIAADYEGGLSLQQLANRYGISKQYASKLVKV